MFEYVTLAVRWDKLQDVLNARGSEGWRVVHLTVDGEAPRMCEVVLERREQPVAVQTAPAGFAGFAGPWTDDCRPHSRACGIQRHPHGPQCARDCPTCHGVGSR